MTLLSPFPLGNRKLLTLQELSRTGEMRTFTAHEVADFSSDDFPTAFPPAGSYTWYRTVNEGRSRTTP